MGPAAVILLAATFAASAWLTRRFTVPGSFFHVLDLPNERSLHHTPVPRSGGVAILLSLLAAGLAAQLLAGLPGTVAWIAVGAMGLGLVSFIEDRHGVKRRYRLLAHLVAALLLLPPGLGLGHLELAGRTLELAPLIAWPLTLLYSVWMTNLYNFMDGMDGFAGGMAVIGFATFAWLGWNAGAPGFALSSALVAAAAGGFLLWNFPPARIFMGDAGSASLGFLAAALSLWGTRGGLFPLWVALLVFSPFILDASVTLLSRLLRGERIWQPHRSHYYQRLVQVGWGHRRTVLWSYLLMGACALSAIRGVDMGADDQLRLLAMWAVIYGLIAFKVRLLERQTGGAAR